MAFFKLGIILIFSLYPIDSKLQWESNLNQAKVLASKQNKPILLVFSGSDWCRNCILLNEEVFSDPDFIELATKEMVLLKADFPRKRKNQLASAQKAHNIQLAEKFNPTGDFPKVILMDPGEKIKYETGYQQGKKRQFLSNLKNHLSDG